MTEWGIDTLFNPGKRHMDEEKRRLQSTREEIGDSSGGKRIDLESGVVRIARPKQAESDGAESDDAVDDDSASDDATDETDAVVTDSDAVVTDSDTVATESAPTGSAPAAEK
jgi:hypothetical protein